MGDVGFYIIMAIAIIYGPAVAALVKISTLRGEVEGLKSEVRRLSSMVSGMRERPVMATVPEEAAPPLVVETQEVAVAEKIAEITELVEVADITQTIEAEEVIVEETAPVAAAVEVAEERQLHVVQPPEEPLYRGAIQEQSPELFSGIIQSLKNFISGGNSWVAVGVGVLIIGLGFFAQYAAKQGLFPVELRLALVALCGMAITALGWRLREGKTSYALILQGGGVATLYLTIFATLKLTSFLPAGGAFFLLTAIVLLSAALALLQNSQALAVLAAIGGFAAPIMVSSGSGNYIALFSFYALLNLGILLIAYYRLWEWLNLIGFALTFGIGAIWGQRSYTHDKFMTTEPFLLLFFLIYTAISVMSFLKSAEKTKREESVDLILAFGTPFIFCALQGYMVKNIEYGLAVSSLGLGALYILIAKYLWRRVGEMSRMIVELFVASGVIFANLAIPLALSGQWTSALWAVEGFLLYLFGIRSNRRSIAFFGLLLQILGGMFLFKDNPAHATAILNPLFIGGMLVALCAIASAILPKPEEDFITGGNGLLLTWGLLWWYGILFNEIRSFVGDGDVSSILMIAASLSALLFYWLAQKFDCEKLKVPAAAVPILLTLFLMFGNIVYMRFEFSVFAFAEALLRGHPLARWGILAWPLLFVSLCLALLLLEELDDEWRGKALTVKILYSLGFLWFYSILALEIATFIPERDAGSLFFIAVSLSSALFCLLSERHSLPHLKAAAAFPIALVAFISLENLFAFGTIFELSRQNDSGWLFSLSQMLLGTHPLTRWGIVAWPLFFATHYWLLYQLPENKAVRRGHLVAFLLAVLLVQVEVQYWVYRILTPGVGSGAGISPWWASLAVLLVLPGVITALFTRWESIPEKIRRDYAPIYLLRGCGTICFFLFLWFVCTLLKAGNPAPMPYFPILNPLELAQALCLGTVALWVIAVKKRRELGVMIPARIWVSLLATALFIWSNAALLRVIFHYAGAYRLFSSRSAGFFSDYMLPVGSIMRISLFQTCLTVLWALWGSALMYAGCRKLQNRAVWLAGSSILALNTLKIFFVDLAQTGTLTRIASFIATGIVLILIGYFAPLPPQKTEQERTDGGI